MEDDEEDSSAAVDLNGSDTLPALAQSTNPLFPNAIVKRPTHAHGKAAPKASTKSNAAAIAAEEKEEKEREKENEKEKKERERKANQSVGPSPQTKPYGAKYTPVSLSLIALHPMDKEMGTIRADMG